MMVRSAAIYARPDRGEALELAREAYRLLSRLGLQVFYEASIAGLLGGPAADLRFREVDLVVVIGGDGTLLRLLQLLQDREPLLYLVKLGRRAYLFPDTPPGEAVSRLPELLGSNSFAVEEYRRLRVEGPGFRLYALNEAAVLALGSKVVGLRVQVGDSIVYRGLEGDGLLVSTPAGSTAYNYSAGGPVLHPGLDAVALTPVNPVNRAAGPLVVPGSERVRVLVERTIRPVKLIVDGVVERLLYKGALIEASLRGAPSVRVIREPGVAGRLRLPWMV